MKDKVGKQHPQTLINESNSVSGGTYLANIRPWAQASAENWGLGTPVYNPSTKEDKEGRSEAVGHPQL